MQDSGGPRGRAQAPSLFDAVLAEVSALRQRAGITQRRVLETCKRTQTLPIVTLHMRATGLEDRVVATYDTILCAVSHPKIQPVFRDVLCRTLNVGGDFGESLGVRRQGLHGSGGALDSLINEAFDELASFLIRCDEPPCVGTSNAEAIDVIKDLRVVLEDLVSVVDRVLYQARLTRQKVSPEMELLALLPRLNHALEVQEGSSLEEAVRQMLDHAIPDLLGPYDDRSSSKHRAWEYANYAKGRCRLPDTDVTRSEVSDEVARHLSALILRVEESDRWTKSGHGSESW